MDFEKLYNACYMQVYSYSVTLCKDRNLAEEITQETFVRALSAKSASFRGESSELTWLCSIAKNLFSDEMRRRKHFGEMPADTASDDDVYDKAEAKDMSFRIHTVLHSLEEPYKEVFELRVFGELSFLQIASIFAKSENWARVTYHRARLKIKERMRHDE